jgi:hypothetical protein
MDSGAPFIKYLHSIHTGISSPGDRVFCDHHREGDKMPTVLGPALKNGKCIQEWLFLHDFLAGGMFYQAGMEVCKIHKLGDGFNFFPPSEW